MVLTRRKTKKCSTMPKTHKSTKKATLAKIPPSKATQPCGAASQSSVAMPSTKDKTHQEQETTWTDRRLWRVKEVIVERRNANAWEFKLGSAVSAGVLMDDRTIVAARKDDDDEERIWLEGVADGELLGLSTKALLHGATIRQHDKDRQRKYSRRDHACRMSRDSGLAVLGHEMERCVEFLHTRDVGSLLRVDKATNDAAKRSISALRLTASAYTIILERLAAPQRLRVLDVTAYAVFSVKIPATKIANACPCLESLTLRQVYTSLRPKDRTTVFQLNAVSGRIVPQGRGLEDSHESFAQRAFRELVHAIDATELRLVLSDESWLDQAEHFGTFSVLTPSLRKLTLATVQSTGPACSWRADDTWSVDVPTEALKALTRGSQLEHLAVQGSVRVDTAFFEWCTTSLENFKSLKAPRLCTAAEDKKRSRRQYTRHWWTLTGSRNLPLSADDVDRLASEVSAEAASLRACFASGRLRKLATTLVHVRPLNTHTPASPRDSERLAAAKARLCAAKDEIAAAIAGAGAVDDLSLTFSSDNYDSFWSPRSYDQTDWPNVSEVITMPSLSSLRLEGSQFGYGYVNTDSKKHVGRIIASGHVFQPKLARLRRVHLENVIFATPHELCIDHPKSLRTIELKGMYQLKGLRLDKLPHLSHFTLDHGAKPDDVTQGHFVQKHPDILHSIVIEDCPKLNSLIVNADAFDDDDAAIIIKGSVQKLSTLIITKSASKRSSAAGPAAPAAILKENLRSYLAAAVPPSGSGGDDDDEVERSAPQQRPPARQHKGGHQDGTGTASPSPEVQLDFAFPGWRDRLEAASASPDALQAWIKELAAQLKIYELGSGGTAAALLFAILKSQRARLVGSCCRLSLAHDLPIATARLEHVSVRLFGPSNLRLGKETVDLVMNQLDEPSATAVFDQLRLSGAQVCPSLRRLHLANFHAPNAPPPSKLKRQSKKKKQQIGDALALPPLLRDLELKPAKGTKTIRLNVSACATRLRRLALGGASLNSVDIDTNLDACDTVAVDAERMKTSALRCLLNATPNVRVLSLAKMKALDPDTSLASNTLRSIHVETCTPLVRLVIHGDRLTDACFVRLPKIASIGLLAPFLTNLTFKSCTKITDDILDNNTSSASFDNLQRVQVVNARAVSTNFFKPFAKSKNRANLSLTMRGCDPSFKPKGAMIKGGVR